MEQIDKIILEKQIKKEKKTSERAELIKFFVDTLRDKKGKQYPARRIAVTLSHLQREDLYNFISQCKDVKNRKGIESMQKFFWWSLKSNSSIG
jgi:hypothetical protein